MTRSEEVPGSGTASSDPGSAGTSGSAGERDLASFDQAIHELHGRIADLRVSVTDLGGAPSAPPPQHQAPPAYTEPPPAYAEPPPAYAEPSAYPPPPPAYAEPSPGYAEPSPSYEYAEAPHPAGEYAPEGSDPLGTFSRVDVGPFEDLLAMTAFEEQLSALPSMADVRVRRFGHGRAEIELETEGIVPVAREIMRIAPEAQASMTEDGTLSVELFSERWTGPLTDADGASAEESMPATGEPEDGGERG